MELQNSRRYFVVRTFLLVLAGSSLAGPGWAAGAAKRVLLKDLLGKPVSAYVKAYGAFKKSTTDDGTTMWEFKPPKQIVQLTKSPTRTSVMVYFTAKEIGVEDALKQLGFASKGILLRPIGGGILDSDGTELGNSFKVDGIVKLPAGFTDVQWTKMNDSPSFLVFGP